MPVTSIGEYVFDHMDSIDKYPEGTQLINIGWDHHCMIEAPVCFPVPQEMTLGDIVKNLLPVAYDQHPDFEKINWDEVKWSRDDESITPDMNDSIKDIGIVHKGVLRFKTPGLNGIQGTGS
jgi:phenol/toluene 2-monooxygenase (NADH) P4/A4